MVYSLPMNTDDNLVDGQIPWCRVGHNGENIEGKIYFIWKARHQGSYESIALDNFLFVFLFLCYCEGGEVMSGGGRRRRRLGKEGAVDGGREDGLGLRNGRESVPLFHCLIGL